jgi:hypothetical protein
MAPAPDCHFGNAEETGRCCVAAKDNFEEEIMATAGQTAFEA